MLACIPTLEADVCLALLKWVHGQRVIVVDSLLPVVKGCIFSTLGARHARRDTQ